MWKLLSFHTQMISDQALGNMLLWEGLQVDVRNLNIDILKGSLYEINDYVFKQY